MNTETRTASDHPDKRTSDRRKPRKPHRTPRVTSPEDTWYEIKDIVNEKYEKGRLWYRVDWADHPVTGEPYDPSWVWPCLLSKEKSLLVLLLTHLQDPCRGRDQRRC